MVSPILVGGSTVIEQWIPLMDYAMKKGISLSTLRRHIKSKKVPFKLENGRYLILDGSNGPTSALSKPIAPNPILPTGRSSLRSASMDSEKVIEQLTRELKNAQEEISELKMLIALYEETLPKQGLDV